MTDDDLPMTDRDPAGMSDAELAAEYADVADVTDGAMVPTGAVPEAAWDRRAALWTEMVSRVDAEPPECPRCGAQAWAQSAGEAKECTECWLLLGSEHEGLIEEIDQYWQIVQSLGGAPADA